MTTITCPGLPKAKTPEWLPMPPGATKRDYPHVILREVKITHAECDPLCLSCGRDLSQGEGAIALYVLGGPESKPTLRYDRYLHPLCAWCATRGKQSVYSQIVRWLEAQSQELEAEHSKTKRHGLMSQEYRASVFDLAIAARNIADIAEAVAGGVDGILMPNETWVLKKIEMQVSHAG